MTPAVPGPALRPLPRFTFAGRGCRDPRREPRRLPQPQRIPPPGQRSGTPPPVATARSAGGYPSAGPASGRTDPDGDRPPPAALRYGPGPWLKPNNLWWWSGAAMPS